MQSRSLLTTLSLLFVLAAGGQFVSVVAVAPAIAEFPVRVGEDNVSRSARVRSDGIVVRDERDLSDPKTDELNAITAQRIELRQAAADLKLERTKMEKVRGELEAQKNERQVRLANLYAHMPPEKAASILSGLEATEAASFISVMPGDAAAEILASMSDEYAVAVTEVLVSDLR